jgi:hypothetical protein
VTAEDLAAHGYMRALWLFGEPKHYLRPNGLSVCTEEEALREVAELVVDVLAADGMAASGPSPSRMSARSTAGGLSSLCAARWSRWRASRPRTEMHEIDPEWLQPDNIDELRRPIEWLSAFRGSYETETAVDECFAISRGIRVTTRPGGGCHSEIPEPGYRRSARRGEFSGLQLGRRMADGKDDDGAFERQTD